ncbi:ABC transporter ATP-binding protein [Myxococcota bacterium]|nr:ABC transporter ATP-binding protein [Myxococcota bacterium]
MSFFEAQGVTRRYAGASEDAIHAIDISLDAGDSLVLVGESGSGKTTFLRCIAGFEIPDRGTIRCQGKAWVSPTEWLPPEKRGIGMLFQDYALFPHLRVGANIAFGLRHLTRAEQEQTVTRTLAQVRLTGYAERYPHQLSGGQQQRVALARALAAHPRLLLLDEPFSNLDEMVKAEIREEIYGLLRTLGIATISVVHDSRDALRCGDQIALLHRGRLLQVASPQDLYLRPASCYAARFLGPANLVPAERKAGAYHCALGVLPAPHDPRPPAQGWLCIRPEHLSMGGAQISDIPLIAISCAIRACHFLGPYWEIHLTPHPAHPQTALLYASSPAPIRPALFGDPSKDAAPPTQGAETSWIAHLSTHAPPTPHTTATFYVSAHHLCWIE